MFVSIRVITNKTIKKVKLLPREQEMGFRKGKMQPLPTVFNCITNTSSAHSLSGECVIFPVFISKIWDTVTSAIGNLLSKIQVGTQ